MTDRQRLALLRSAEKELKLTTQGFVQWKAEGKEGGHWKRGLAAIDKLELDLAAKPAWGNVGPVTKPGASLLDMFLTHKTSGILLFPAVDLAFGAAGISIYAPEACVVDTRDTHANPGEALFLSGVSKLRYWFGHLDRDWPLGKKFSKGALLGKTVNQPDPKDHSHVGVNAEAYLGKGKQLKYGRTGTGPDYTYGSPTIRSQLLALEA